MRYTRRGLAYADDWGTLRNSANSALLALVYARHAPDAAPALECWAHSQLRCAAAPALCKLHRLIPACSRASNPGSLAQQDTSN